MLKAVMTAVVLATATFSMALAPVDVADDEQLPIKLSAISKGGNPTNVPGGYTISFDDPNMGTWVPRDFTDPTSIDGYFVPAGPVGPVTLSVDAVNSRGKAIHGEQEINVIAGPAYEIIITPLAPVLQ